MFSYRTIHRFFYKHAHLFLLALIVILGYLPISFQLLSLKNDIIQLDLPVKYFISQELHRGEWPVWIYSWKAGFPLGHLFSWSMYNPITLFFCGLFKYDIHVLHLEFMTYLLIGGFGTYAICKKNLLFSKTSSITAAAVYSLSGIVVSYSQFLGHIAAIGLLPWVIYCTILLLKKPNLYHNLLLVFTSFCFISWSYPGLVMGGIYSVLIILIAAFSIFEIKFEKKQFWYLLLSSLLVLILCLPLIYITLQTLPVFSRSEHLSDNYSDFGYLHISSLLTILFPFYNSNFNHPNTTFLFQNIFFGSITLGVLLIGFFEKDIRRKKLFIFLIVAAIISLMLSFGESFYVKPLFDKIVPGFKWFRFPSLFRVFFILPISIVVGLVVNHIILKYKTQNSFKFKHKLVLLIPVIVAFLLILIKLFEQQNFPEFFNIFSTEYIFRYILWVCTIWFVCLILSLVFIKKFIYLITLLLVDLAFMALISMPIYSVSSYSLKEMNNILMGNEGFKSFQISIDDTTGVYIDKKGNEFNSINIYKNSINIKDQYTGPLFLKSFELLNQSNYNQDLPTQLIFEDNLNGSSLIVMENSTFADHFFSADVQLQDNSKINLFQVYHPFWKAYVDGKEAEILQSKDGIIQVPVPVGDHHVKFVYEDRKMEILTYIFFILLIILISILFILKMKSIGLFLK